MMEQHVDSDRDEEMTQGIKRRKQIRTPRSDISLNVKSKAIFKRKINIASGLTNISTANNHQVLWLFDSK